MGIRAKLHLHNFLLAEELCNLALIKTEKAMPMSWQWNLGEPVVWDESQPITSHGDLKL
jgi:hypothetical protein